MRIERIQRDDITIVVVEGEIDVATAPLLQKQVKDLVVEGQVKLLFDFSDVEHITSSGLAVLALSLQLTRPKNGAVAIAGATGLTKQVLEVWAGKHRPFVPCFATVDEAAQSMSGKS